MSLRPAGATSLCYLGHIARPFGGDRQKKGVSLRFQALFSV